MIRLAQPQDEPQILAAAIAYPGIGPKLWVQWQLQQQNSAFGYRFYCVGETAVLSLENDTASFYGTVPNEEELEKFLFFTGVQKLTSATWVPQGWLQTPLHCMYRPSAGNCLPYPLPSNVDVQPAMDEVMKVLESTEPLLPQVFHDSFYADTCARRNHGYAAVLGLRTSTGQMVSSAGIYALTPHEAYLAGVETCPDHRGKGYASVLVQALCGLYADRMVSLLCKPELISFYAALGFVKGKTVWAANAPEE